MRLEPTDDCVALTVAWFLLACKLPIFLFSCFPTFLLMCREPEGSSQNSIVLSTQSPHSRENHHRKNWPTSARGIVRSDFPDSDSSPRSLSQLRMHAQAFIRKGVCKSSKERHKNPEKHDFHHLNSPLLQHLCLSPAALGTLTGHVMDS
jgi:hypothetical protein